MWCPVPLVAGVFFARSDMDILNDEFARLLKKSGWRQSEAAKHLELSPAVITRYLNGDTHPSLTVLKLFQLLIGDMQALPGVVASGPNHEGELEPPLDAAERQLIGQLRALPEAERRRVVQGFCVVLGAMEKKPVAAVKVKARRRKVKPQNTQNTQKGNMVAPVG
jgi:transcriptional regulator with XRE-family HTH domain